VRITYDVIYAMVRTSEPFGSVTELRDGIMRHARQPYGIVCLTDQPERCEGVEFIDITGAGLPGPWAKMLVFEKTWRGRSRIVYLGLDVEVAGDLAPLQAVPGEFAICGRLDGRYNSSVMVIGAGMASFVWERFEKQSALLMAEGGDAQAVIEMLYPDAPLLQRFVPKGFFQRTVIPASPLR
jgi:hypothetical protein